MRFTLFWLIVFFAMAAANAADKALHPYTNIQSISYSQPVSINAMISQWSPPFKGGDKALTYNRAEIGMTRQNWFIGIFERYDFLLTFSDQTAQLYFRTTNHLPLETGKQYAVRIEANAQFSRGVRLGFQHQLFPSLKAGAAVSYLQGLALTDGRLDGTAQAIASNDYNFQFDANYVYSHDALFSRSVQAPQGNGYSLDIHLNWQPSTRLAGQLTVADLLGRIYWNKAPYTIATASSATKTYDTDGYVHYNPVISGLESNKDFVQRLPRKIFAATQYQLTQKVKLLFELQDLDVARFISAGMGWRLTGGSHLSGLYNLSASAFILRYQQQHLLLELGSDSLSRTRAHYLVFSFSYRQTF